MEKNVAQYETTDYAQMRRCRMAHLHSQLVDEQFKDEAGSVFVSGYVHTVRPDLTCWPLRWTITIQQQSASAPALALAE